jgi:hypothetical protein
MGERDARTITQPMPQENAQLPNFVKKIYMAADSSPLDPSSYVLFRLQLTKYYGSPERNEHLSYNDILIYISNASTIGDLIRDWRLGAGTRAHECPFSAATNPAVRVFFRVGTLIAIAKRGRLEDATLSVRTNCRPSR